MLPFKLRVLKKISDLTGPPVCRILPSPAGTRDPVPPASVRRILVIRPGGIGDAVHTLPMIAALGAHYQGARLDVLAEARNRGVYELAPGVARIYCYDRSPLGTLSGLRRNRYDLVIDTEQFHHLSAVVAGTLGARSICGFETLNRARLRTHAVPYRDDEFEARSFLDLAESVVGGPIRFDRETAVLAVADSHAAWAATALAPAGNRPLATVSPAASHRNRIWPVERFAGVVRWLLRRNLAVALLGGGDAVEIAAAVSASVDSEGVLDFTGRATLGQSAALLARAAVALSPDTGGLHLAWGVGAPTVSLFGPGRHEKWAPVGPRHVMVRKELPCSPCTRFGRQVPCPDNGACMRAIQVADVTAAMGKVLDT